MKGLREFEIPYVGLRLGVHKFEFDICKPAVVDVIPDVTPELMIARFP